MSLHELIAEYSKYGGNAFVGDEAWKHIEDKAGDTMGKFVERYVRIPLREVDTSYKNLQPISFFSGADELSIQIGGQSLLITRDKVQVDYEEPESKSVDITEDE